MGSFTVAVSQACIQVQVKCEANQRFGPQSSPATDAGPLHLVVVYTMSRQWQEGEDDNTERREVWV